MPMGLLTIVQFSAVFGAYSLMTLVLPALIFRKRFSNYRLIERFFLYLTIGNFYLMNLVFLLQLLHISNRYTLLFGTIIPAMAAFIKFRRVPIGSVVQSQWTYTVRFTEGRLGKRTLLVMIWGWIVKKMKAAARWWIRQIKLSGLEWLLIGGLIVALCWQYGSNLLVKYAYSTSDIIVHNYWINALGQGELFVAGVYPFGFHCVIYYLHEVFAIDTYVILRVFWLVQVLYIHLVLFSFIRLCCKTRFCAYIGISLYVLSNFLFDITYSRYYSSLPQEFGMLFILPSIWFLLRFLRSDKEGEKEKVPFEPLLFFALCFSMTLAVHFYGTMIAGLFCVAIAIAYIPRVFTKQYFWRIAGAGMLSMFIAILPMGIAFATGTPLQGSLGWGMNVITGASSKAEGNDSDESEQQSTDTEENSSDSEDGERIPEITDGEQQSSSEKVTQENHKNSSEEMTAQDSIEDQNVKKSRALAADWSSESRESAIRKHLVETLRNPFSGIGKLMKTLSSAVEDKVFQQFPKQMSRIILVGIAILVLLGFASIVMQNKDYGKGLIGCGVFIMFLLILLAAGRLGLPALMDGNRTSVYLTYMLSLIWGLAPDAVLTCFIGNVWKGRISNAISFLLPVTMALVLFVTGMIREPMSPPVGQTNGAVTCLTSIIRENKDKTWTICSANEELRMGEDRGWHYETIDFLRKMEGDVSNTVIHIPTPKVYFFIEKIPIDYFGNVYWGSGQSISEEGAEMELPSQSGLQIYMRENRWVIMSRMYEWAQAFQKLYSNEMKVYYEDEEFICYSLEQNEYRLYNFAIDYGYNTKRVSQTGESHR